MGEQRDPAIQALIDKQAITEVLNSYCRAIDRRDWDLLRAIYWPEAIDDHAVFRGSPDEFIAYSAPFMVGMQTAHRISNVLIDLYAPGMAFSECYFAAYHNIPGEDGRTDRTVGGRYLDRLERRDGEWRIIERTLSIDWYTEMPATSVWDRGRYADLPFRGAAKPDDPLYRLHPPALKV